MVDQPFTLTECNLEASTTISLKREAACFGFLSANAVSPPLPIDAINLDLASVDYYGGRASLWATLELRSSAINDQPIAVLGFDEGFLRPFSRAVIEAAATRAAYRMTINRDGQSRRNRVVEYVSGPGVPLTDLVVTPYDHVLLVAATSATTEQTESLFQLPRSDTFLRAFAKMTYQTDQALRDILTEHERLALRAPLTASTTV